MHVSHLTLHDFRSYPRPTSPSSPGVTAFLGSNGQGKTNLVEAVDYLARLSSHRVAARRPLVQAGRRPGGRPGGGGQGRARGGARGADQPGPVQPGAGQQVAAAAGPRAARAWCARCCSRRRTWPWSRATRRSGGGSSTTCWCSAPRGLPGCAPTTTGCSSSATPCSRPPGRPPPGPRATSARCPRSAVWDSHLARTGAELLAGPAGAGRRAAAATSPRRTTRWPRAPPAPTRR